MSEPFQIYFSSGEYCVGKNEKLFRISTKSFTRSISEEYYQYLLKEIQNPIEIDIWTVELDRIRVYSGHQIEFFGWIYTVEDDKMQEILGKMGYLNNEWNDKREINNA